MRRTKNVFELHQPSFQIKMATECKKICPSKVFTSKKYPRPYKVSLLSQPFKSSWQSSQSSNRPTSSPSTQSYELELWVAFQFGPSQSAFQVRPSGKCLMSVYFNSIPSRFQVDFKSISSRYQVGFKSISSQCQVNFKSISRPFQVDLKSCTAV